MTRQQVWLPLGAQEAPAGTPQLEEQENRESSSGKPEQSQAVISEVDSKSYT